MNMNDKKASHKLGKQAEQESLEISSTGYGLESVSSSQEQESTMKAQKGNDSESYRASL